MIKVIAFDIFGTVFDLASASKQEVKDYGAHIRQKEWAPLHLPLSWENLPAHPDSREGIERLRSNFIVVTCSNGPLGLQIKLSKRSGIVWDGIIPLELNKVFKPNPRAYRTACEVLGVPTEEVLMITANEKFGDLEAARSIGMESILIRDESYPTIIDLAKFLEKGVVPTT